MADRLRGSPQEMGFVRTPEHDHLIKKNVGWEVWATPEGVLLTLPPGCQEVELEPLTGVRGTTMVCVSPPGVNSIWPYVRKAEED